MKQTYTLNESELRNLINECVQEVLNEQENEGLGKNMRAAWSAFKGNQTKGAEGNAFQKSAQTISNKFNAAKENFRNQNQYDKIGKIRQELQELVSNGSINGDITVNELLSNFGGLSGMRRNITNTMKQNGGQRIK
jgi:hypothetical protein